MLPGTLALLIAPTRASFERICAWLRLTPRAERYLSAAVLIALICISTWLRIEYERGDTALINDEGISLLAATCHQVEYSRGGASTQIGRWVEARDWKRFVRIEKRFCFATISADVALTDYHPPLYFWALHLWLLVCERFSWLSFPNMLFAAATCALVYVFAFALFGRRTDALVAVALWATNPHSIASVLNVRPYALLGLTSMAYLVALLRTTARPPVRRDWVQLGCAAMLAMLTQYIFVYLVVATFTAALVDAANWRRWLRAAAATACGIGGAAMLHPVFAQMSKARKLLHADRAEMQDAAATAVTYLMRYYGLLWQSARAHSLPVVILPLLAGLVLLALHSGRASAPAVGPELAPVSKALWWAVATLLVAGGLLTAAFAIGAIPPHAFAVGQLHTSKQIAMLMPLMSVALVAATRLFGGMRLAALLAVLVCSAYAGRDGLRSPSKRQSLFDEAPAPNGETELLAAPVVVNSANRKLLPLLLLQVPIADTSPMFVAEQQDLLRDIDAWAPIFRSDKGTMYLYRRTAHRTRSEFNNLGIQFGKGKSVLRSWMRFGVNGWRKPL